LASEFPRVTSPAFLWSDIGCSMSGIHSRNKQTRQEMRRSSFRIERERERLWVGFIRKTRCKKPGAKAQCMLDFLIVGGLHSYTRRQSQIKALEQECERQSYSGRSSPWISVHRPSLKVATWSLDFFLLQGLPLETRWLLGQRSVGAGARPELVRYNPFLGPWDARVS